MLVEIDHGRGKRLSPGESKQLMREALAAFGGGRNHLEQADVFWLF